jgi:hypothetical protein
LAISALKGIIARTAKQCNKWDGGPNRNIWKTLKHTVAAHQKCRRLIVVFEEDTHDGTYHSNLILSNNLQKIWDGIVDKLRKARRTLADQQTKLKEMRRAKVKGQRSIETKVFLVLKEIGVELSSYHGGSLNGKDIKKVMINASHIFDKSLHQYKRRGRGRNVCCQMLTSNQCVCIFGRFMFCGTEHFC